MQRRFDIDTGLITPNKDAVLRAQGVPNNTGLSLRVELIAESAIREFKRLALPVGVLCEVSIERFARMLEGKGKNEQDNPLAGIFPEADRLALFAVTLGAPISAEITRLFAANDFAEAAMLDAAASEGADLAAEWIESSFRNQLKTRSSLSKDMGTLRFSPGYCGWHVSGQKALFSILAPDDIGITLTESCLMQPLKSVSGVILAGQKAIFEFEDTYPFCADCQTRTCRDRIRAVQGQ